MRTGIPCKVTPVNIFSVAIGLEHARLPLPGSGAKEDAKFNYAADRDEIVKEESVFLALVIDI
jgi:hypothetical protein